MGEQPAEPGQEQGYRHGGARQGGRTRTRTPVNVLVCDRLTVVTAGIRAVLERQPDIGVVGEVTDGHRAVAVARTLRPDVAIVDAGLPPLECEELVRRLRQTAVLAPPKVIALETDGGFDPVPVISAGASAVLSKRDIVDCLAYAVHVVARTDVLIVPGVFSSRLHWLAGNPGRGAVTAVPCTGLTAREREVLLLVARGLTNCQIAAALHVREATVRSHLYHLLHKLGLRDRAHAVAFAYEMGLVRAAAT
ncbi:MAG TPA: response regulator transcription factor [Micromonosporaceae bacterium]|nr:response regulator transcription factor [Micromonosporaceae bacterium]